MGRELKRKEAKKKKNNSEPIVWKNEQKLTTKEEIMKFLKILIIVVVVLGIIYFVMQVFVTKEISFNKKEPINTTQKVSNQILAIDTFRQKEETYYVYFYDFNDENKNIENAIVSRLYSSKIYRVDVSSGLNSKYISEESNRSASSKDDLKINGITFIMIENGQNTKYFEGETEILGYINN